MSNIEVLAEKLYEKACEEMTAFETRLKSSTPEEVIQSAYKLIIQHDILSTFEDAENTFSEEQLEALLKMDHVLDSCYLEWLDNDYSHMDLIRETIATFADSFSNAFTTANESLIYVAVFNYSGSGYDLLNRFSEELENNFPNECSVSLVNGDTLCFRGLTGAEISKLMESVGADYNYSYDSPEAAWNVDDTASIGKPMSLREFLSYFDFHYDIVSAEGQYEVGIRKALIANGDLSPEEADKNLICLIDEQGAYLGDIHKERYPIDQASVNKIIDRMDAYINDSIISEFVTALEDRNIDTSDLSLADMVSKCKALEVGDGEVSYCLAEVVTRPELIFIEEVAELTREELIKINDDRISLGMNGDTLEIYIDNILLAEVSNGRLDWDFASDILYGLGYEVVESPSVEQRKSSLDSQIQAAETKVKEADHQNSGKDIEPIR